MVGIELGAGVAVRHRAEAAADLAALAAAGRAVHGTAAACARAAAIAGGMDTRLRTCRLDGWDVLVATEADLALTVLGPPTVTARARAGPAQPDPPPDPPPVAGPDGTPTPPPPPGAPSTPPAPPASPPGGGPSARSATPSGRNRSSSGHGARGAAGHAAAGAPMRPQPPSAALVVTGLPIGDDRWCRRRLRCLLGGRQESPPRLLRPAPRAAAGPARPPT
ncbi:Rv3654c family TadE-like protein [Pseudonocardia petroleophila]|uniref:Rv3654c family TadE-like protein n=1 Tax=Pseudonocardia petroleophila TaxID=37331 RepID=UPI0035E7713C